MSEKKWKVHGLEKALENVPENERSALAAQIEAELSNLDPDDPSAERVLPVAPGTRICPSCKGALVELGFIPTPEDEALCVLECENCDASFSERVAVPLQ